MRAPGAAATHGRVAALVEWMLDLHRRLPAADREIDAPVYDPAPDGFAGVEAGAGRPVVGTVNSLPAEISAMEPPYFPLNVPFRPSPTFRLWYAVVALLAVLLAVAVYVPIALFTDVPFLVTVALAVLIAVVFALFLIWTLLYYASMEYELRDDELSWRRGVWFRRTGIVPYSRITNIDIRQGPVMRALGISNLAIQTAGYSGQMTAEIVLEAMEHAEDLRAALRAQVRHAAGGDGTGSGPSVPVSGPDDTGLRILDELRTIRALLEERR